jgi:N-acetylmuramoyl-L-alanine amidase
MKRIQALLLVLALLACSVSAGAAGANGEISFGLDEDGTGVYQEATGQVVQLTLNGAALDSDVPAFLRGGRTMVPVRLITQALGADVQWFGETNEVAISLNGSTVQLKIGSAQAQVNGETVTLYDAVPAMVAKYQGIERTMVPLRFVSEQLGCQVEWIQASYTAAITLTQTELETDAIHTAQAQPSEDSVSGAQTDAEPADLPQSPWDESAIPSAPTDQPELPAQTQPEDSTVQSAQTLVVVDAGHGGSDPGAIYEGVNEKDVNLAIAQRVAALLRAQGYQVLMTRDSDTAVGLYTRAEIANEAGADLFVSIHANAANNAPEFAGIYTYYHPSSRRGARLAQAIQTPICAQTEAVDRGTASANYVVLRETDMCAVLVETGFMSNSAELRQLLTSAYQEKLAAGIVEGIAAYLNAQNEAASV